jgi:Ca-activated chloride channel family protein
MVLMLWLISRDASSDTPWRKIVDAGLQPLLMGAEQQQRSRLPMWLLAGSWFVAALALADPVWEREPQPLLQTSMSRVIVFDLSRSMLATDMKPSRLARARFKVEDILTHDNEGVTGLVVFAGDAFTVTPLTRDAETIRAQLKALEPVIMPSQGSRADLGLEKALELLQQAGAVQGQIILIADGVEGRLSEEAAEQIALSGHSVSVLGVGTGEGVPLYDDYGNMLRDASGKPVVVKLDSNLLRRVALAGSGRYREITGSNQDINALLTISDSGESQTVDDLRTEKWKEQGPFLTLLLLPLAALAFRRGWLVSIMLVAGFSFQPQTAMAFGWNDLWQRNDQQAAEALKQEQFDRVAELSDNPDQLGSAAYKQGNFQQALENFSKLQGADADYNRGNTLARLGKYEEAISAYDEALQKQPEMEDAKVNKASVEELLKRLEEQQNQPDQQKQDQQQESKEDDNQSEQSDQEQQQQDSRQGEEENQQEQSDSGSESEQQQQGSESSEQQQGEEQSASEDGAEEKADQGQQGDTADEAQQAESASGEQDKTENQFAKANEQLDKNQQGEKEAEEQRLMAEESEGKEGEEEMPDEQVMQSGVDEKPAEAESLTSEEQMAAQQWLRRIPDDPGGLLRRKFLHQYRQRGNTPPRQGQQRW